MVRVYKRILICRIKTCRPVRVVDHAFGPLAESLMRLCIFESHDFSVCLVVLSLYEDSLLPEKNLLTSLLIRMFSSQKFIPYFEVNSILIFI
jgi:hypothetical protein